MDTDPEYAHWQIFWTSKRGSNKWSTFQINIYNCSNTHGYNNLSGLYALMLLYVCL
jgi:hypothetical protein